MEPVEIPLEDRQSTRSEHASEHSVQDILPQDFPREHDALPPADGGHRAWLCLLGCFVANVLIWGFAFSFGVLQEYYTTHEPFSSRPSGIPAIGTTATGLGYLTMPVYFFAFQRFPHWRRWSCFASLPLIAAALVGASLADSVMQLILCQGVLFALAGNALITPTITYLDEWFIRRKGLAIGIMWAGDGTGGVIMPLLMQAMLSRIGFRWTLRAIAGMLVILTAPLLYFLKPRVPVSTTTTPRSMNVSFLRSPAFWTLQVFNMLQACGYFMPTNYLPTYVQSLGLDSTFGSLSLLLTNLSAIFGCVIVGFLADRFDITAILFGLSTLAATSVLLIMGLATTVPPIVVFCIAYGLTAGGYSTSWGGMVKDIQRQNEGIDTSMLFGCLAAGRGVGAVISGPLSESLLAAGKASHPRQAFAYGTQFEYIIIFSGCTALVGGGSWFIRRAGWI